MDVDLNIDNYNLNDLLTLFKLPYNFTSQQVKEAKKIVLKMHPDKSKLSKDYFLFFSKAYKTIVQIHDFRIKASKSNFSQEYEDVIEDNEQDKQEIVNNIKKSNKFNKFFNKMFVKMKQTSDFESGGYEIWLKDNNHNTNLNATTMDSLHNNFNKLKQEKREVVVYKEVDDVIDELSSGSNFISEKSPSSYTNSNLFTKSNYIDIKEAYDNPVIPVTHQDYINKKKYSNINELQQDRKNNENFSHSILESQAKSYYSRKKQIETEEGNETAFKLIKQEELSRKNDALFWGHLKLLENSNK